MKTLGSAMTSMSQAPDNAIDQVTRPTQIIIGSLISGVTIFLLIVVFLVHFAGFGALAGPNPPATAQSIPFITYIAVGMAAILLPLSFILPGLVATQSLRSAAGGGPDGGSSPTKDAASTPGAVGGPAAAFQTSAIIGGALNEGAAFFAVIAYLIEQNPIALVTALILLAALVVRFPTRGRVDRWIALQEEKLRSGYS